MKIALVRPSMHGRRTSDVMQPLVFPFCAHSRHPTSWNRPSSVISRFFDAKTHLSSLAHAVTYLRYNPLYSKETFKKQGMRLGYHENSIHPQRPGPLTAPGTGCDLMVG